MRARFRGLGLAGALWCLCSAQAMAQAWPMRSVCAAATLRATQPDGARLAEVSLTLRPEAGLEALAGRVAAVMEVRANGLVAVGLAPPPGMAEAVPHGHLALLQAEDGVRLVLGARDGLFTEALVRVRSISGMEEARAVAMAAEALQDELRAAVASGQGPDPERSLQPLTPAPTPGSRDVAPTEPTPEPAVTPTAHPDGLLVDTVPELDTRPIGEGFLGEIELSGYGQIYAGASSFSRVLQMGAAVGGGLCAVRHCLLLNAELPLTEGAPHDLRYRYLTFSSMFVSRPWTVDGFTPGAALGLLTRLGRFEADVGFGDSGLQTDLAARAVLEAGYAVGKHVDVVAEAGVDLALDRLRLSDGNTDLRRGDRWIPWVQAGLRMHP